MLPPVSAWTALGFLVTIPSPRSLARLQGWHQSPFPWLPNAAVHQRSAVSGFLGSLTDNPEREQAWVTAGG